MPERMDGYCDIMEFKMPHLDGKCIVGTNERTEVDAEKIKFVAKTANVNFVIAKQMLEKREACILKAKAPKIKLVITKLQELGIDFNVNPSFNY